jgi:hypothetical protein
MWRELTDLAQKIPATFWGVLAGSFFTLVGVTFTNRSNDKRLSKQLAHDRQIKAKERDCRATEGDLPRGFRGNSGSPYCYTALREYGAVR